jgi:hypothetical protein
MFCTWVSAVRSLITSRAAIWRLVKPCATRPATSSSRLLNGQRVRPPPAGVSLG